MISAGYRIPSAIQLIIIIYAVNVSAENVEIVTPENTKTVTVEPRNVTAAPNDSYLRAYEEVQKLRVGPASRNDYREPPEPPATPATPATHSTPGAHGGHGDYNTVIRSSHVYDDKYPSLTHQWAPPHADSPLPVYAPPLSHHYHEWHGAPAPLAPPARPCRPTPYSSPPHSFLSFLPKKLTLKILLKILLKLVLFKMIVKFIAVICLLLFIPALKSKETSAENADADERRKARELDEMSNLIWDSIEEKNSLYGEDEEMKGVEELVKDEEEEEEEENPFSGPVKAVKFLEFCVSAVDRVVGYILAVLKRQRNENDDLSSFVYEKLSDFVKNL